MPRAMAACNSTERRRPRRVQRSRRSFVDGTSMELLGSRVGLLGDADVRWVHEHVAGHQHMIDRITTMPVQAAMHMLRASVLPRLNFVMRTVPPAITRSGLRDFDERIRRAF